MRLFSEMTQKVKSEVTGQLEIVEHDQKRTTNIWVHHEISCDSELSAFHRPFRRRLAAGTTKRWNGWRDNDGIKSSAIDVSMLLERIQPSDAALQNPVEGELGTRFHVLLRRIPEERYADLISPVDELCQQAALSNPGLTSYQHKPSVPLAERVDMFAEVR
jgi:hypothetical protein